MFLSRYISIGVIFVTSLVVYKSCYASMHKAKIEHGFVGWGIMGDVKIGMSRSEIISMLGAPSYIPLGKQGRDITYMSIIKTRSNTMLKIATLSFDESDKVLFSNITTKKIDISITRHAAEHATIAKPTFAKRLFYSLKSSRPSMPSM